jgi:hypothetical protein
MSAGRDPAVAAAHVCFAPIATGLLRHRGWARCARFGRCRSYQLAGQWRLSESLADQFDRAPKQPAPHEDVVVLGADQNGPADKHPPRPAEMVVIGFRRQRLVPRPDSEGLTRRVPVQTATYMMLLSMSATIGVARR